MHELLSVPTPMLGPFNQKSNIAIRNQVVDDGNTSPVVFPIENQRLPPMVANERPGIPRQNHFNMMFDEESMEILSNFLPGRNLRGINRPMMVPKIPRRGCERFVMPTLEPIDEFN